jgi:hypothetical protein
VGSISQQQKVIIYKRVREGGSEGVREGGKEERLPLFSISA